MKPQFPALLAAFAFALFYVFSRFAVRSSSPFSAILWTNGICAALFGLLLPFLSIPSAVSPRGMVYLALAGICSPALAVFFVIQGSRRIGVSRTGAVGGLAPILASVFAVLFLRENPSFRVLAGTVLIVLGVATLALEKAARGWDWPGLGFPLLAALCLALTAIFRKLALQEIPAPAFGALVQTWASLLFLLLLSPLVPAGERFRWERAAHLHFLPAGLFLTAGLYLYFSALEVGDLTIVTPLIHTWPFLVTAISSLFLQRLDRVTKTFDDLEHLLQFERVRTEDLRLSDIPREMQVAPQTARQFLLATALVVGGGFLIMG